MKTTARRITALFIALLLLSGMATTALAKETYSNPFSLNDHYKAPADDANDDTTPPEDGQSDPQDPADPEEPTDPGEDDPQDPVDPELPEEPTDPGEDAPKDPVQGTVQTEDENGSLNLRETPDPEGVIIMTIPYGAQLTIIRYEGEWAYVDYEGTQGYVAARYVQVAEPVEEEPVIEEPVERKAQIYADKDPGALYLGDVMSMWVELTGYEDVTVSVQWQTRSEDSDWSDIPGAAELNYTVTITEDNAGHSWRARISTDD